MKTEPCVTNMVHPRIFSTQSGRHGRELFGRRQRFPKSVGRSQNGSAAFEVSRDGSLFAIDEPGVENASIHSE
jgi:hypothetical protein